MNAPIETGLGQLRRRIRWVLGIYGISWVLAVAVGLATACGLSDWILELSPGVRATLLILLAGAVLWTICRRLLIPLLYPLRDLELALRIEARFPKLRGKLASAVEFLRELPESERSGSPALKRLVVEDAARHAQTIDPTRVLDLSGTRRTVASAAGILALALGFVLLDLNSASIAVARLLDPFGDVTWPRQTHLQLLDPPTRLARGEPFRIRVLVAQGRVPDNAELHYQFEGGESLSEPLRPYSDRQFTGGLQAVSQSFDFYVSAGDGLTNLRHVTVVPAPRLEQLQVRLNFPPYTGQPPEDLPEGKGQVRAVWGTEVQVDTRASKPLESATLHLGSSDTIPAHLNASKRELGVSFQLKANGSYWFTLRDQEGFENRDAARYQLHVLEDQPPSVHVEQPSSDMEVTRDAEVPVRILVKDDFGIQDVSLHYASSASDQVSDTILPLWKDSELARGAVVEYVWRLADLSVTPGTTINYRATARDYDTLRGPNRGESRRLRLLVVSRDELTRSLEARQALIYQELERVRKLQTEARTQVVDLQEQLDHTDMLQKSDLNRLQAAEVLQRRVQRRISSPTEGLEAEVARMQNDLANNHLQDPELTEQLGALETGLQKIAQDELPSTQLNLSRARKSAQRALAEAQVQVDNQHPLPEWLARTQQGQEAVISALDEMIEGMAKWQSYRGIIRDAQELLGSQKQLAEDTRQTARQTIGRAVEQLPAESRAALAKLATRQEKSREQLGRLAQKIAQMSSRIANSDRVASGTLRDAASGLEQAGTSDQMNRAAGAIQQNRVGMAQAAQRDVIEDLQKLLDTLENNRVKDLAEVIAKLREAEEKLADIRGRQAAQLERTKQAQADPEAEKKLRRLAGEQRELEQLTGQLARQLRRYMADLAGRKVDSASQGMSRAGAQLEQGQGQDAEAEQQGVLEQIDQAQQELARARRAAEAALAAEQVARSSETLAALLQRQRAVHQATVRLEQAREEKDTWARPQLAFLRKITQDQETIRDGTKGAGEVLSAAPVFALVLRRAASNMAEAADRLNNRLTDRKTQAVEQTAAEHLAQLLDALKNEPGHQQAEQAEGGGAGSGSGGSPNDGVPPIAQLKLLRTLQSEINRQTSHLEELRRQAGKLSLAQEGKLRSLSEEQGTLAELFQSLVRPAGDGETP